MTVGNRALMGVIVCALVAPAMAQSVNLDLGHDGNGAPSSYRGVGLPGYWHSFPATEWGLYYDLVDLNGQPIGARVRQIGGTEIVEATFGGNGPAGGDAALLGDALVTHNSVENCLFFEGLENGTYEVITYAWMPTSPTTKSNVRIDNSTYEPLVGGTWTGVLEENIIYARHEIVVFAGWLQPHTGIPPGGDTVIGAALNGVQIRLMGAEPPIFMDRARILWLAALNAADYRVVRGDLETLRTTGGDFFVATEECVGSDLAGDSVSYSTDPDPGEGHWFVVSGTGMTWNSPGDSQAADRDAEIDGAVNTCP